MRSRTPISPAQVSRMCRGCHPLRLTVGILQPRSWCSCTGGIRGTGCGRSRAGTAPNRSSGPSASGARRPPTIGSCRRLVGGGGSRLPSAPGTSPLRTGLRPSSPVCLWPYAPWPGGSLLGIRCWCRAEPHSVPWPPPPSPARRPRRSRGSHGARGPTAGRRVVPRLPSERARRSRTPSKEPRSGAVSSPSLLAVSPLLTLKMSFSSFTFASSSFSCRL